MAFVKLDTGILNSTLWIERECREVFITALLMAEPREFMRPVPQIEVRSLEFTGFEVPPGWYGFVEAAGVGIVRRAMVDHEVGLNALEKLSSVDPESRSKDFDGRRLIRVDGGYLVLNFMKYRDRDYTAAVRSQRYRDRKKAQEESAKENPSRRDISASHRDITQADKQKQKQKQSAESEEEKKEKTTKRVPRLTVQDLMEVGVEEAHARDWMEIRRLKKQPLTQTAWEAVKTESVKAGLTIPQAIAAAAANGWGGFKASWLERSSNKPQQTFRERDEANARAKAAAWSGGILGQDQNTIEMEAPIGRISSR